MLHIRYLWEDSLSGSIGLNNDVLVELSVFHTERLVKGCSLMVIQVHGDVHGQAEETRPHAGLEVIQELWTSLKDSSEEITVARFILAPVLKVLEHWIELVVWVSLQVSIDGNVSPVANLLRKICGIHNELWLEEGIGSVLSQESQVQGQVEIRQGFVNESGVASLISTQQCEDLSHNWVAILETASQLFVQQESRELGSAGSLQEFDENLSGRSSNLIGGGLEGVIADEMGLVVVSSELVQHSLQLIHSQVWILVQIEQISHLIEIGGVESAHQPNKVI